jgi:hypothetical protein
MMDTPSGRIIAAAAAPLTVRDGDGRELVLRRLGPLDRLRLFKALGSELAQNPPYLGMAMLAASVTAIDAIPVPVPATEAQIEAVVGRLGDTGLSAVAAGLSDEAASMGSTTQGN